MFDTISIGSATLDMFLKSSHFSLIAELPPNPSNPQQEGMEGLCVPYGSKLDVDDFTMQSGGGGTNTAVALARQGFRSAVVAEMGTDLPSKVILQELADENVDTSLVVQEPDEQTAISALLVSGEGGRSIVTARGASKMLTLKDIPFKKLQANWIHISSIGNTEVVVEVARHCRENRIRFSWNPGGAELQAIADGEIHLQEVYPTLFTVNQEEADRIVDAGYQLESAGSTVVITNGSKGGRFYEHSQWQEFGSEKTKVVQETGAGDGFTSGMIGAYLHDRLTPEAIEWGKTNAQSVIRHMGAKTGLLANPRSTQDK